MADALTLRVRMSDALSVHVRKADRMAYVVRSDLCTDIHRPGAEYLASLRPERPKRLLRPDAAPASGRRIFFLMERDSRLLYRDCVYVLDHPPLRLQMLQDHHDAPAMRHPGCAKTLELLMRKYFWPSMWKDVDQFVRNCHVCCRTNSTRHAPYRALRPLLVPGRPWQHVPINFLTGLPRSNGYDAICVVVDCLTK